MKLLKNSSAETSWTDQTITWQDTIKMHPAEMSHDSWQRMQLASNRIQWRVSLTRALQW